VAELNVQNQQNSSGLHSWSWRRRTWTSCPVAGLAGRTNRRAAEAPNQSGESHMSKGKVEVERMAPS